MCISRARSGRGASPRSDCSHDASCWRRSGRRGSHVALTGAPAELGTRSVVRSDGMGREHGDGALGRGQLLSQSRGRRKELLAVEGVVLNPCGPRRWQPAAVAEALAGGVERESPAGRASAIRVRASRVSEGWKWAGAQRPGRRGQRPPRAGLPSGADSPPHVREYAEQAEQDVLRVTVVLQSFHL